MVKPQEELKHMSSGSADVNSASLQIVPAEFALKAGSSQKFDIFTLDASGKRIAKVNTFGSDQENPNWEKWIPPTAKVKSKVDAVIEGGILRADQNASLSAGALRVSYGNLFGVTRGRVLPNLPYKEDFEDGYIFSNTSTDDIAFSYPPLSWLGARMRWQVQDMEENKVAGNTLDRVLFQRAIRRSLILKQRSEP